jgi:hypothetical protein
MYLLESEKGSRNLARPPRKRGGAASQRGISFEQVCVIVARDRTGQTLDFRFLLERLWRHVRDLPRAQALPDVLRPCPSGVRQPRRFPIRTGK